MMTDPSHARPSSHLLSLVALTCAALLSASALAEPPHPAPAAKNPVPLAPKMEFEKYYLVLLRRGPSWTPAQTPETENIQKEHLAHLWHMGELGKLVIAGPFDEQDDEGYRGMCLYKTETREEARKLAEEDPAVKSGRLKVEVMAWYTQKGALAFPKAPPTK